MDSECYHNYYLVQFKAVDTGIVHYFERIDELGVMFDIKLMRRVMQGYQIITFNGQDYDLPLMCYAMEGATNADLKVASDRIIEQGMRGWQFEQAYDVRVPAEWDHIDLREPVPGVQISLKLYGARLHSRKLQDLPYHHDKILTVPEMEFVRSYCENDLDTTIDLLKEATKPSDDILATREALTKEFGIDLRSKSDAQIAEAAIKAKVTKLKGEPVPRQEVPPGTAYSYLPPPFLRFDNPVMREVFQTVLNAKFVVNDKGSIEMPEELSAMRVPLGRSIYTMGIGGLHSNEKCTAHVANSRVVLRDRDVVSYYPSLILQCGLFPENMGKDFQTVYSDFFRRRITAKKAGDKSTAQTLKIVLNGTFGKLGSKWSVLYAPNLMIQVTITGQLALLMLIERMEGSGIPVVSANTDGIVMACPVEREERMKEIVAQWERDTGLETEETQYTALYSRDVNSYLAIKPDGKVKTKGALAPSDAQHNPTREIVKKAVIAQLAKGVPVAQTILECRDVREFLTVQRVTGGAQLITSTKMLDEWEWQKDLWVMQHGGKTHIAKRKSRPAPLEVPATAEYLGKVVRFYHSSKSKDLIAYVGSGNRVPNAQGVVPLMTLNGDFPDDINYGFYINEANDLLKEIGALE